jgi:hypothetical protein
VNLLNKFKVIKFLPEPRQKEQGAPREDEDCCRIGEACKRGCNVGITDGRDL